MNYWDVTPKTIAVALPEHITPDMFAASIDFLLKEFVKDLGGELKIDWGDDDDEV